MDHPESITMWLTVLSAGALLVRIGQTIAGVGTVRAKNAASAISRGVCDLFIVVLAFTFLGIRVVTWRADIPAMMLPGLTFYYAVLVLIATGIVGPAVAERSRFLVPIAAGAMLSVVVVPISMRWVWYGWLARMGVIDVAGSVPLHWAGSVCALAAVLVVGSRSGKYNRDGSTNGIPGHHVPNICVGSLFMVAGWLPYMIAASLLNGDGDIARAALNTLVAIAAGGLAAAGVAHARSRRNDLPVTCAGMICGAVAITAAGGTIAPWQAGVLAAIAGWTAPVLLLEMDLRLRVDDPGGTVAVHGIGALVGTLGAGIFSSGSFASRLHAIGVQAMALASVGVFTFAASLVLFAFLKKAVGLRVSESAEYDGLDLGEHDVNAYPDFQQTTIKSYHLREA